MLLSDERVRRVAAAVLNLRTKRDDADYNHFAQFTRDTASALVEQEADAVSKVESQEFAGSSTGQSFLQMIAEQYTNRDPSAEEADSGSA